MNVVSIACIGAALVCTATFPTARAQSGDVNVVASAAAVSSSVSLTIAGLSAASVSAMPGFPVKAYRDGYRRGRVRLDYTVNGDGTVSDVNVVDAFPVEVFTRSARKAVSAWRFVPIGTSARRSVEFQFRAD